ncbi:glycosyltransferase [Nitrosospira multiformis]|uniref:glycosyltransferase n=1 Tax=Nitrosospira multiformis TaxID=1231 RepID=UPI001C408E03|nr:glycosyltransferase [Nitrosospira multiformis]
MMTDNRKKRLIIVLGMHRSGTSAITRGLQVMGVELGDNLMPAVENVNAKGFWEDLDIYALNNELLSLLGSDWHHLTAIGLKDVEALRKSGYFAKAVDLLCQKVEKKNVFGFKDPRVAKLLPFWKEVFIQCQFDTSYVLVVRHPLSVAKSLAKRDGFDVEKSYFLWLGHIIESLTSSAGMQRVLVDYDKLMLSPEFEINRIAKGLDLEINPVELDSYITQFLDETLRHTAYDLNDLSLDDACPLLIREIYTELLNATSDKILLDDPILKDKIEQWTNEWQRLKPILTLADRLSSLNPLGKQIASLKQALVEHDGQIASLLEQALVERDGQIASLEQALVKHDGQIVSLLEQALVERDGQIASFEQALVERDGQIASFEQALIERDGQIASFEQALIERDGQIASLEQALIERDGQIASLEQATKEINNDVAKLQQEITDILASTSWRISRPIRMAKTALIAVKPNSERWALFTHSAWFNRLLPRAYRNLPVSSHIKVPPQQIYPRPPATTLNLDPNREALPAVAISEDQFNHANPCILVIDLRIPTPDQDSGSVRMFAILQLFKELKFCVTFISDSDAHLPDYKEALQRQGIHVLQGYDAARSHLAATGGKYHFAFLSRPEVAFRYLPYVRAYALYCKVIYDTVDLHWVRFEREMQVSGNQALRDVIAKSKRVELFNLTCADLTMAITHEEKEQLLIEQPDAEVAILPNIHALCPPRTPFSQRSGLLFIGGFWHQPNVDAVMYFVAEILPRISEIVPDLVFYVIGSNMPDSIASLQSPNVQSLGFVPDVTPYFESCRIFVAPLRYGAGMKGKVGQSMSHGLPVVTSTIGAEGMGLAHEEHLLIADQPQDFADAVARLYQDELLWRKLSKSALSYLEENYSYAAARKRLSHILKGFKEELTTDNTEPNVENETSISSENVSTDSKQLQKVSV